MSSVAATSRAVSTSTARGPRQARSRVLSYPHPPPELDSVAARWQSALDSAQRAVAAADGHFGLPPAELKQRRAALAEERRQTQALLLRLAHETHVPEPWLSPVRLTPTMLGLEAHIAACVFDLEGVLTDSATLHAAAWSEVFDPYLGALAAATGLHYKPFDVREDYRSYVDGRSRIEAVHAFLESRGVHVPEGRPTDPSHSDTAYGLARRKGEALARSLRHRGVTALPGTRKYLQACGYAGLQRAAVSASTNSELMLELTRLNTLLDVQVDATTMETEHLRSRPFPDAIVSVCHTLKIESAELVSFTHTPAGIAAAHAAGVAAIGVGGGEDAELLRAYGAERVIPSLSRLLDDRQ